MTQKIKTVTRKTWYKESKSDHYRSDVHPVRYTNTYAMLYNGDGVFIDEDDIREHYHRTNITEKLINELNNSLHNKRIETYSSADGSYWLKGKLSDYIITSNECRKE